MSANKLIILDRDGVINQDSDNFVKSEDEWIALPGSLEAIARLNHAGYIVTVATNQSGLARGLFTIDTLNAMHQKMRTLLARVGGQVDGIFFCPHGPDDNCECRKPKGGMYKEISQRFGIPLNDVPVIGDSGRDLEAAVSVRAKPILVRTGKGERTIAAGQWNDVPTYDDLAAAVEGLLN